MMIQKNPTSPPMPEKAISHRTVKWEGKMNFILFFGLDFLYKE
jgi:hypothetical protein